MSKRQCVKEQVVGLCTSVKVFLLISLQTTQILPLKWSSHNKVLAIVKFLYYSLSLTLWSVPHLMPLAYSPAVLSRVVLLASLLVLMCSPFRSSACPRTWASTASFIQCIFILHSGISYLGFVHFRIVLSSFPGLWLSSCILGWPVRSVICYPLLGVHSSMSIVRLIMTGYCCNHLDGQLNYWASAHSLIGGITIYQLCNW